MINEYYFKIIKKQIQTTNTFNQINTSLYEDLKRIINEFIDLHITDLVREYYGIKSDIYDRQLENQTPINEFLNKLIDHIAMRGIIQLDSVIYSNIKQFVHIHMNELISKTLDYTRIIIDVLHRWIINYYNSLKTLDIITTKYDSN